MRTLHSVALSAAMCTSPTASASSGLFDPAYYEDLVARPFREGTMAEAPVLPGIGLFMPAGTSAGKDKGLFRLTVPEFHFDSCTGCMECALVCPDAAIPNTVHEIHDLLLTGIKEMDVVDAQREALRAQVYALAERVREAYRQDKTPRAFHEVVADVVRTLDADNPTLLRNLDTLVSTLAMFPVARTRPFFDAMESDIPGTGALFAATIDPWKCTGCLECIEVCGPGALTPLDQDADTPGDPAGSVRVHVAAAEHAQALLRGIDRSRRRPQAAPARPPQLLRHGGRPRRLPRLRRGHRDPAGHGDQSCARRRTPSRAPARAGLADRPAAGQAGRRWTPPMPSAALGSRRSSRPSRPGCTCTRAVPPATVRRRRSSPTPPAAAASTRPRCPTTPTSTRGSTACSRTPSRWPRASSRASRRRSSPTSRRCASPDWSSTDAYDPALHENEFRMLSWSEFTSEELDLLPTVLTIGGDGASYDIGFGAMSRVLASDTPIKILVLDSGAYSNTGGQASTSSYTGQDSDLSRFGASHDGKHEGRKELGPHRVVPPARLRMRDEHGDARALPAEHHAPARVPGAGGHGCLHAVRWRAGHLRVVVQRASPAGRREPHAPALRPRSPSGGRPCTIGSHSRATRTSTRRGRPARWSTSTPRATSN